MHPSLLAEAGLDPEGAAMVKGTLGPRVHSFTWHPFLELGFCSDPYFSSKLVTFLSCPYSLKECFLYYFPLGAGPGP